MMDPPKDQAGCNTKDRNFRQCIFFVRKLKQLDFEH